MRLKSVHGPMRPASTEKRREKEERREKSVSQHLNKTI
jgi:hypothetical protein